MRKILGDILRRSWRFTVTAVIVGLALGFSGLPMQSAGVTTPIDQTMSQALLATQAPKSPTPTPTKSLAAQSSAQPVSGTKTQVASTTSGGPRAQYIGMFIDAAPSDPNFRATLDQVAATGCNLVYSYNAYDGTTSQVNTFLAYAQSKGLKVIFALNDFYDQLPQGASTAATYSQYGSTNDQIARTLVADYQGNPDVWGFSITDEAPEGPSDLASWQGTLNTRYGEIKQLTAKPVMAVLVGWADGNENNRINFFSASKSFADTLALDYYPVPYELLSRIPQIMADAGRGNWFIEQVFSWSSYPSVVAGWGYNPSLARLPTEAEMVTMGQSALNAGAQSILLYSDFDISSNPTQLAQVAQAVQALKN